MKIVIASLETQYIEFPQVVMPHQLGHQKPPPVPFLHQGSIVVSAKLLKTQPGIIIEEGPQILFKQELACKTVCINDRYVQMKVQLKLKDDCWSGLLFGMSCVVRGGGEQLDVGQRAGVRICQVGRMMIRGEYLGARAEPIWDDLQREVNKLLKFPK